MKKDSYSTPKSVAEFVTAIGSFLGANHVYCLARKQWFNSFAQCWEFDRKGKFIKHRITHFINAHLPRHRKELLQALGGDLRLVRAAILEQLQNDSRYSVPLVDEITIYPDDRAEAARLLRRNKAQPKSKREIKTALLSSHGAVAKVSQAVTN
jgi:hypothetical protein